MGTIYFENKPRIIATGTIAGPKECAGVVGKYVDKTLTDDMFGETTYEKAECKMLSYAISKAIKNANLQEKDVDLLISGDLLNQIISASFAARDFDFPFLGVYGACSTMAESMAVGAAFVNSGYCKKYTPRILAFGQDCGERGCQSHGDWCHNANDDLSKVAVQYGACG